MKGAFKRMLGLLALLLAGLAAFALLLVWLEPRLLYYPLRELERTPESLGLPYEDLTLLAADGVTLHAWFLPRPGDPQPPRGGAPAGARGPRVVLFCHGNAGNISHRFEKVAFFHRAGVDVLLFDYRGYGRSEGRPDEAGTYRDARAAYDWLAGSRAVPPERLVLYGESLGAAVAVRLATEVPVAGVMLEAAFTSVADVGQGMYPFLPVRWMVRNRYDSLARIGSLRAPLLLLHSRDDEFFSMRHPERLLAAARAPKRLVELRGGHNEAFLVSAETYGVAVGEFLAGLGVAGP
jgi:fermentation-respiration switch protein FrsA (DUF1100 family)